jgi:hypothetical protein
LPSSRLHQFPKRLFLVELSQLSATKASFSI